MQLSAHFTVELMIVVAYDSTIIISDFEIVARNSVPPGSTSIETSDRIEAKIEGCSVMMNTNRLKLLMFVLYLTVLYEAYQASAK